MTTDDGAFTVSPKQWEALGLVVDRAEEKLVTYVVKSPKGDAAISRKTAAALFRRGFINVAAGEHAHPTAGGRAALASYRRRHPDADARP